MKITNLIMDFDGTCTQIPEIYERFLSQYREGLNKTTFIDNPITVDEWSETQRLIREYSPTAAWTLATTAAAPAAADPYILSYEAAQFLLRKNNISKAIPAEVFGNTSEQNPAPWRIEAREIFEIILKHGIKITFISNSSSKTINGRLKSLWADSAVPSGISVKSDAKKFQISELNWDSKISLENKTLFQDLPAINHAVNIGRPIYLRRASYFEAICEALDNDLTKLPNTLFCGDIWEMDLAMPHQLGANIHLIERAAPFDTYEYECSAMPNSKEQISIDLRGLLNWL